MRIAHSAVVARLAPVLAALVLGFAAPRSLWAQGNLEIPASGSLQSGIGFIAGWRCKAGTLTFTIDDGPAAPLSYGISRGDTQSSGGGDINNGFIAEENWYFAGDGQHTIKVFDNGAQFAEATFTVTTLGQEF